MVKKILFVFLMLLNLIAFGKIEEKTIYPDFRYLFKNEHEARTRLTDRINLSYRIPKKLNSGITHIQFFDIKLKNINKNIWLDLSECSQSKRIPVAEMHSIYFPVRDRNSFNYIGVRFQYGNDEESNHDTKTGYLSSYMKGMEDFEDYLATFTVKCFNKSGKLVFSRDMEVLQSRYYQKQKYGFFQRVRSSWTPGRCYIYVKEENPPIKMMTFYWHSKFGNIYGCYYGKFVIKDNKIIFEEDESKREAYYLKYISTDYFINEKGQRDFKEHNEKINVKAKKYPYINIYDSDYYKKKR